MLTDGKTPRERLEELSRTPVRYMEVEIPTRDGMTLAADVYLPDRREGGAPSPTIVLGTPYDKRAGMHAIEAEMYQDHGYSVVCFDVRGRGKSEGVWRPYVHDGVDGYDVVEWAAAQRWSNGRVGVTGLSYSGWIVWAIAREGPPHLKAAIASAAAGRWQQEIPFTNGVFQLYYAQWTYKTRRRIMNNAGASHIDWNKTIRMLPIDAMMESLGVEGPLWLDMRDHEALDDFWQGLRLDDHYRHIDIPILHVNGWHDLEDLLGGFAHWEGMIQDSPARRRQQLLVGPWPHIATRWPQRRYGGVDFGPDASLEMDEVHRRFFDHWLKGVDNGAERDAPIRVFEMGPNRWREWHQWPETHDSHWHLRNTGGIGALSEAPPAVDEGSRAYRYDPLDPVTTDWDFARLSNDEAPLDQAYIEPRPDVLVYTSEPLTEAIAVAGWPHLELFAVSDCDDTDWHVRLTDVDAAGRSIRVSSGCLRASFGESLSHPKPVRPGVCTLYDIEFSPVVHTFLPGHRIRVLVTSSDFPWFERNLNRFGNRFTIAESRVATNQVRSAPEFPSRLRLPVLGVDGEQP